MAGKTDWWDAGEFTFFRLPRAIIENEKYAALSGDAKLLYALLLNRISLSAANGWRDGAGEIFLYFTNAEICRTLGCSPGKATALLRAVNVPARYVTGYVCKVSGPKTTVTSLNAHAWVEYFVDGAWRKLDPTPGEGERDDPTPTTEPTTEAPPTETIIPTDETLPVPTHTRPVAPTGETVVRPTPTEAESTGESPVRPLPGPPAETPTGKAVSGTLWIVLGVIGLLFLIWLRRYLARLLRQRRLERTNGNQKAIWMYRRITRLNRRIHVKNAEEVEAMGKKAAFSQHELDNDELNVLYRGMLVAEVRMGRTRP